METSVYRPQQPKEIAYALIALGFWTIWTTLSGFRETIGILPDVQTAIAQLLDDSMNVNAKTLYNAVIVIYAALAITLLWVMLKIGEGKPWARSSLLWGCVLETAWTIAPPYHELSGYLQDVPELGLQFLALYFLYDKAGSSWFTPPKPSYDKN